MVLLQQLRAQDVARSTLNRAIGSGRVHHAYLFDGPAGVGKELAAFGLAQALVCERRRDGEESACGACSACQRAAPREGARTSSHPDVILIERGLYEPGQIGRRSPETQDISIDQVRTVVLARAAYGPHEGRARVFIVRRAEELSVPAANALLKTLEEPGKGTHFVLLTAHPDLLLPTILSRTSRVRFASLPDGVVSDLLARRGITGEQAASIARLAGGGMESALALADPEESAQREAFVTQAMTALEAPGYAAALDAAEEAKRMPKDRLVVALAAFASALAARARADLAVPAAVKAAARHPFALAALTELDGNASPQLVVESMLLKMRAAS